MKTANGRLRYWWRRMLHAYANVETVRRLQARFPTAIFGDGIFVTSPHLLDLGEHVIIERGTILNCGGLEWSEGRGKIAIGDHSVIGPHSILWGAGEIQLGAGFGCGPGTMIFSSAEDFMGRLPVLEPPPVRFGPVVAGEFVTVYSGAILSPGVNLGDGAVIAAGAVVTGDVPSREFWGGVPARIIRELPRWDDGAVSGAV